MRKRLLSALMAMLTALCVGCASADTRSDGALHKTPGITAAAAFSEAPARVLRNVSAIPGITPYDFIANSGQHPRASKSYTLMIYMNGSDLESVYAAGTADIKEMLASHFDENLLNILILTGGCDKWHTKAIPNHVNTIFQLTGKGLTKLANAGNDSTGEPKVLAGFLRFGATLFPAKQMGLVLWNHGGGAVVGYGADERFANQPDRAVMKLTDIDTALKNAGLAAKLSFLGFDTCLMSTLEMAHIAQNYANYLVASEEVEPEDGWDYTFLREIKQGATGYDIGKNIIDYYGRYYGNSDLDEFTTLSLTDLSKIEPTIDDFEQFAESAGSALNAGQYHLLSRARSRTRSFGSGGEDGETDMVDIAEMANRLSVLFPEQVQKLNASLQAAVVYKYESREEHIGGLSVYFPYYNKESIPYNIQIYQSLNQLPQYTSFISNFSKILGSMPQYNGFRNSQVKIGSAANPQFVLSDEQREYLADTRVTTWQKITGPEHSFYIQVGDNESVTIQNDGSIQYANNLKTLNGHVVCTYDTNYSTVKRYSIPVLYNGEDANLIVVCGKAYPKGKVIGAIPTNNDVFNMLDKKLIQIEDGDKITLRYYAIDFDTDPDVIDVKKSQSWYIGDEFIVQGELLLEEKPVDKKMYIQKLNLIDTQNNNHYVDIP